MNNSRRVRSASRFTKSRRRDFESNLNAYSTAGKAAAAVVAMGAASAHGQTITNLTSANFGTDPGHLTWHITGIPTTSTSGSVQSNFHQSHVYVGHNTYGLNPNVSQGNGSNFMGGTVALAGFGKIARSSASTRNAANLSRGAHLNNLVGANFGGNGLHSYRLFHTSTFGYASTRLGGQGQRGNFAATVGHPASGYLGFKMGTTGHLGNYYFGWLKVRVGVDPNGRPNEFTLVPVSGNILGAYALSNDPNIANFKAGDYVSAIPEPANVAAGLGLLALGAVGVREHRRRRKLAA